MYRHLDNKELLSLFLSRLPTCRVEGHQIPASMDPLNTFTKTSVSMSYNQRRDLYNILGHIFCEFAYFGHIFDIQKMTT